MQDESVQCCCTDANTNDTCCKESSSDSEVDNKSLKRCQSPMVVISVYPMQNGENVKVLKKPPIDKKTLWAERSLNINNNNEDQQNNNINKITRESRSANKNPRRFFANKNPGRSRSRSPSPQKEYQIRSNDNDKRVLKSKIDRKISPMRETTVTSNWDNRQVKINQDKLKRNKDRNKTWTRYEKWRINEHKSTNTDYNVTKKLLVENYTKHLTAFMQNNKIKNECTCTRSNDSNVQVNIDGSDQCYDVTLCQGKHITDLKVRKTKKRAADAKGTDKINDSEKNETSSLKNLLLIPECESNGRSISQALSAENQQRNEDTFPRIRIRDSLEIKHSDNNSKTSTKISNNQLKRCACSDITIKSSNSIKARNTTLSRLPKMKCACKLSVSKRLEYCKYLNNRTYQQNQDTSPQTESNQKNMQCECSLSTQISSADKKDVQCECNISVSSFHSNKVIEASKKSGYNNDNKATQYEDTPVQHTSWYQQLILNRNIQVFLQVEQFSKQKPIILSRKQYDKVKRTIENTLSNKSKRNKCICKSSLLSLGEVRRKSKRQKSILDNKEVETQLYGGSSESKTDNSSVKNTKQENTYLLLTREQNTNEKDEETPRQVASKVEFRISSLSYTKYVAFSSTNVEVGSTGSAFDDRPSLSLHTIFKGRRKCTSPNLGTSMCSLNSEEDTGELKSKNHQPINEPKIKKPFLRRLMSCLVMRSARLTEMNAKIKAATRPSNKPSIDSSFDSYHISSSFCVS
ncbi:unnamed protein product [Diatraea saccharalis]|uniref:Uncharacterized protein n=1 Tax=Diatraea saccharalis TaxID=40085 RepID=A0A9N9R6Z5_9NEOP|nr:unnamed protein product [Diatraea saccharalis]